MKKVRFGFVIVMVVALAASLYAQQSVAGTWTMSVPGMSLGLVMAQDGEKISGTLESPHGQIQLKGEFSKGKLTLAGASTDSHPVQFSGNGTLGVDGSLSGSLSVNQGVNLMEMPFTAVRTAAR